MSTDANDKNIVERDRFWSPWRGLGILDIDRMFREFTDSFMRFPFGETGLLERDWRVPFSEMEYDKEKNEIRLVLEMPGLEKKDIEINVNGRNVKIRGQNDNRKYMRSYTLPRELDPSNVKASFNNGILEITIGIMEEESGHIVDID